MKKGEPETFDILIIGGGPAGLSAGIYATRSGLKSLLIEKSCVGGQAITTDRIENYPGFPEPISGPDLLERMKMQAEGFGLEIREFSSVNAIEKGDGFRIAISGGWQLTAKAVILATGAEYREMDVPGSKELRGRGISYCATCDGPFFKGKPIAVVGGGNAAVEEALYLTRFASKVSIIHRRDSLRADKVLQDRALNDPRIEILWNTVTREIKGIDRVEGIVLEDTTTHALSVIDVAGVFVYIGTVPNTGLVKGLLDLDDNGYIMTDDQMSTSVPGIFAAGDCRHKRLRQVVTATGEGAMAAMMSYHFIQDGRRDVR